MRDHLIDAAVEAGRRVRSADASAERWPELAPLTRDERVEVFARLAGRRSVSVALLPVYMNGKVQG
jgi:hypothetical protein